MSTTPARRPGAGQERREQEHHRPPGGDESGESAREALPLPRQSPEAVSSEPAARRPDARNIGRPGTASGRARRGAGGSALRALDTALFVFAGVSAVWLAYLVLAESIQPNWQVLLLLVFWLLVAYLVLPRLHRALTYLYVPNYFLGRTRTSDGRLGDAVNLALRGSEPQIHAAMTTAGWTLADEVTFASSARIISTTMARRSYPQAPVSPLYLFERRQDFAYQQEVEGSPSQRHHVRFWRCPDGWWLPGGYSVDWVAAGSYDRSVGLSLMTFQVTHRIAKDIDVERDHIVASLASANPTARVVRIRHFASGYHARNGGGDEMVTDGDLPVVDLRALAAPATTPVAVAAGSRVERPASTTFSAAVAWARGAVSLVLACLLLADPTGIPVLAEGVVSSGAVATATGTGLILVAVLDIGLGIATYYGRNWARLLLMLSSTAAVVTVFAATARGGPLPTLGSGLPHVALSILVLLALTSPGARHYAEQGTARRHSRQRNLRPQSEQA